MLNNNAFDSVDNIEALLQAKDWESYQLVMYPRRLCGDFAGLAKVLVSSQLKTNDFSEVTIGDPETTSGCQTFEDAYQQVSSRLTSEQDQAFQQIMIDAELIKDFYPRLDVEIADIRYGNVKWHTDQGFEQGRFLCTYTTLATQFRVAGKEIDAGLGTLSRHTTKSSNWKIAASSHRRPFETGASIKTPRLSLKSMRPEFAF